MSKAAEDLLSLLCKRNASASRCSIFREQGKPLKERKCDFKIPEFFIVHLKKPGRIFSFSR